MINSKFLLIVSFIVILIIYIILFSIDEIIKIILDEYISISVTILIIVIYFILKYKLKDKIILYFIPDNEYVSIKNSVLFFIVFEIIDYYSYGDLIQMIKYWFLYWIYGVMGYFLIKVINLYKNYLAYKKIDKNR